MPRNLRSVVTFERLQAAIALSFAAVVGYVIPITKANTIAIVLGGLVGAGVGFSIVICVARKPQLLWPILIMGSIICTGFMFGGYTMFDEYLVGCLILGSLMAVRPGGVRGGNLERLHRFMFLLLVIYLLFQCFRGMVVLGSLRKVRWVVFYLMLGMLIPVLARRRHAVPSVRKMSFLVAVAVLVYFSFYVGYGLLFEAFGINRFDLQYSMIAVGVDLGVIGIWGSTAYTMFPLAIAMPAIFIILKDRNRVFRRIGWITLLVSLCASFYYESRVSVLAITAFMVISFRTLGLRRWLAVAFISVVVLSSFLFFLWEENRDLRFFMSDVYGIGSRLLEAERSGIPGQDIDRYIWTKAAYMSINDNWLHFLFGYGFRTSGYVVAPKVYDLFRIYSRPRAYSEDVATEGFTNLLVDTGMVGLLLLLINCTLVAYRILIQKANPNRGILILSLFLLFGWLFVINIIDVMLFYLAIMPSGLLVQLSRHEPLLLADSRRPSRVACRSGV